MIFIDFSMFTTPFRTFSEISLPRVESLFSENRGGLGELGSMFGGGLGGLPGLIFYDSLVFGDFRMFTAPVQTFSSISLVLPDRKLAF